MAQTAAAPAPPHELVVGVKEAPPFAMKADDGTWNGISVDLWRRVADELHLSYHFIEKTHVQDLIDGVAQGRFDVAVGALTETASRARLLDFTQPFYTAGLGIAVPAGNDPSWRPIIRTLTSFGFMQAVLALVGFAVATGGLLWLFERRHNEDFAGTVTKGMSTGVWWSTMAMTQRHTGLLAPRTLPGRILAIIWMVVSIITIAVFTASVTSSLTIKHLQGAVHDVGDLANARVGVVAGTSSEETLTRLKIAYRRFAAPQDGLKALRAHTLDAFVYDKPLLSWLIQQDFVGSVELIDASFDPQEYAFAMPSDSALGKPVSIAILDAVHSAWWEETLFRYIGPRH